MLGFVVGVSYPQHCRVDDCSHLRRLRSHCRDRNELTWRSSKHVQNSELPVSSVQFSCGDVNAPLSLLCWPRLAESVLFRSGVRPSVCPVLFSNGNNSRGVFF